MNYIDYFTIDQSYYPEITPDTIKNDKNGWLNTYPHKTFIELIKKTVRMLEWSSNIDRHGIWVEGAYGTGKSRVMWTLQRLIDCSDKDFEQYFSRFSVLEKDIDLKEKLKTVRSRGKILTVDRYASGNITDINAFILAVYESVSKSLKKSNLDSIATETVRGSIVKWLEDEIHQSILDASLLRPENKYLGSINNKNARDILSELKNNSKNEFLINDLLKITQKEGLQCYDLSMDSLKSWLTEIITKNDLEAIVFFWDEFSAFFKNNKNSLDVFQQLAEFSENQPFYLIIATHMSMAADTEVKEKNLTKGSFKALYDRFHHIKIEMPNSIAFELIHDAMKVKEQYKDEHHKMVSCLNSEMSGAAKAVCNFANLKDTSVIEGLCPIHPMAALTLKYISESFASNQRSMFNFIKNNDTDQAVRTFQWFIKNKDPDNGDILTIDYLWDFFYVHGKDDVNKDFQGRSNLNITIRDILDAYPRYKDKLGNDENKHRIVKVILMMQAINRLHGSSLDIFKVTDENIRLVFEGDPNLSGDTAINIINHELIKDNIVRKDISGRIQEYSINVLSSDQQQIDEKKKTILNLFKTDKVLSTLKNDLIEKFKFSPSNSFRYDFNIVSIDNFTVTTKKTYDNTKKQNLWKLQAFICCAVRDEETEKMKQLIDAAISNPDYKDFYFIDLSDNTINSDDFEKYIELKANEEYFRTKDTRIADQKAEQALECFNPWIRSIVEGSFILRKASNKNNANLELKRTGNGYNVLNTILTEQTLQKYPLSFDSVDQISESLWSAKNFNQGIRNGINREFSGIYQGSSLRKILRDTINSNNYWEIDSTSPISKLKIELDNFIKNYLNKELRIPIKEMMDFLFNKGFGACSLYAYIAGFLLKEYSTDPYCYSEGSGSDLGHQMDLEHLAKYVEEYFKSRQVNSNKYNDYYIQLMTPNQKEFVNFAHKVLRVQEGSSVETTVIKIRTELNKFLTPIWCYKELYADQEINKFIDDLASILNIPDDKTVPTYADHLGEMLKNNSEIEQKLEAIFNKEKAVEALRLYINKFNNGKIINLANEIGKVDVLEDVHERISKGAATWLWDKTTVDEELNKLITEYQIILKSKVVASIEPGEDFHYCIDSWKKLTQVLIKIPCTQLCSYLPELSDFFNTLKLILEQENLQADRYKLFLDTLEKNSNIISNIKQKCLDLFKESFHKEIENFSNNDIEQLYKNLPNNSFLLEQREYNLIVRREAETIQQTLSSVILRDKWKQLTKTDSPNDWCNKYRTPILIMVPDEEKENAQKLFSAFNNNSDKNLISYALNYLNTEQGYFSNFTNKDEIEKLFAEKLLGKYVVLLKDNDQVRDYLQSNLKYTYIYNWCVDFRVNEAIKAYAVQFYQDRLTNLLEKIQNMDDKDAKNLLSKLVTNSIDVGLSLIYIAGE